MKRFTLGTIGVLLTISGAWVIAQENLPVNNAATAAGNAKATIEEQYSYAIGLDMGTSFRQSDTSLNIQELVAGLQAGLAGAEPKFDRATCGQALQQLQMMMRSKAMAEAKAAGAKNAELGAAYLAKNKTMEGVQVTKSGLQYKVIEPGTGATPALTDTVECNYRGTLIDGTVFDASAKHGGPAKFGVGDVIAGWTEALQMMKVGAKWKLFIPAELAYGDRAPGPTIQPGSTLIFEIELLGIVGN